MDGGSFYSYGIYICRNGPEALLERTSSWALSVAGISVEAGTDRKRRRNRTDGNRMDPGSKTGVCGFSDGNPSGGSGWSLYAGAGTGQKKRNSFCAIPAGWLSDAVYLRLKIKLGRFCGKYRKGAET